jgi:hypothetical protein
MGNQESLNKMNEKSEKMKSTCLLNRLRSGILKELGKTRKDALLEKLQAKDYCSHLRCCCPRLHYTHYCSDQEMISFKLFQ